MSPAVRAVDIAHSFKLEPYTYTSLGLLQSAYLYCMCLSLSMPVSITVSFFLCPCLSVFFSACLSVFFCVVLPFFCLITHFGSHAVGLKIETLLSLSECFLSLFVQLMKYFTIFVAEQVRNIRHKFTLVSLICDSEPSVLREGPEERLGLLCDQPEACRHCRVNAMSYENLPSSVLCSFNLLKHSSKHSGDRNHN